MARGRQSRGVFGELVVDNIVGGGMPPFIQGKKFFVDPVNGSDNNVGTSPTTAFKSLSAAYDACTSDQNDTVYYLATKGTSVANLTSLTWAKESTHLIGVCAPTRVGLRARVFQTAATAGIESFITISASNCIFQNLYLFQGRNEDSAQICVTVTGDRNYFENVHFAGIGHANATDQASRSLLLKGHENTFKNCTIGLDTVQRGASCVELEIQSKSTGVGAARNVFEDCVFVTWSSSASALFVTATGANCLDRFTYFKNCDFLNGVCSGAGSTLTEAMTIDASAGGMIVLSNCNLVGASGWATAAGRANVYVGYGGTVTAATAGLAATVGS